MRLASFGHTGAAPSCEPRRGPGPPLNLKPAANVETGSVNMFDVLCVTLALDRISFERRGRALCGLQSRRAKLAAVVDSCAFWMAKHSTPNAPWFRAPPLASAHRWTSVVRALGLRAP